MTSTPGLYGTYGGRYVPETLIPALDELATAWDQNCGLFVGSPATTTIENVALR